MASHWRIRHKLMLGLGLVAVVLALVLGGTVRGLWSYWFTINVIRSKLTELVAAEDLRSAIGELIAPDTLTNLAADPQRLNTKLDAASARLDTYEAKLAETLSHGRDPDEGEHEQGLIAVLRTDLARLRVEMDRVMRPRAGMIGDSGRKETLWLAMKNVVDRLDQDASDLRDHLKDELDRRLDETKRHYQVSLWIIVPASVVGIAVMAGLCGSFYTWIVQPVRDLVIGVQRLARGDFDHRITLQSGDEMQDLAAAFNDMSARLNDLYNDLARQVNERSRQLVRSERLASVGFLAAGVAHEINNPLASILFCGEALEGRLAGVLGRLPTEDKEVFAKYLRMIQEEALRCKNITERLLAFSRTGEPRREPTDLAGLVQSVLDVTQHLPASKRKHIAFERPARGSVIAPISAEEVKSVVLNLVVNALDSMEEEGRLTIRLGQRDGMAVIEFADTGCGMNQEVLENIFEPFFTRSRTGKGTGLGLTISHRIVTGHGGDIEATSAGPGHGSTFTVRLPLETPEAATLPMTADLRRAA